MKIPWGRRYDSFKKKKRSSKKEGRKIDKLGKLKEVLLKKAIGFEKSEISKEYQVDKAGKETLIRKKVQKKYFPPDLQAMRALLELEKGEDLSQMSDEDLEKEKLRLLNELKEKEREKKHER